MGDRVTGLANAAVVCCLPQSQVEAGEYKDVISSLMIPKSVLPLGVRRPQVGGPLHRPRPLGANVTSEIRVSSSVSWVES